MFAGLPNLPSLAAYPQRNWREAAASSKVHGLPALGVRLADLAQRLQVGYTFLNVQFGKRSAKFILTDLLSTDDCWQIQRSC